MNVGTQQHGLRDGQPACLDARRVFMLMTNSTSTLGAEFPRIVTRLPRSHSAKGAHLVPQTGSAGSTLRVRLTCIFCGARPFMVHFRHPELRCSVPALAFHCINQ